MSMSVGAGGQAFPCRLPPRNLRNRKLLRKMKPCTIKEASKQAAWRLLRVGSAITARFLSVVLSGS